MTVTNEQWIDLCDLASVPPNGAGGAYVVVNRRAYAVFRDGEQVRVVDDACPHAGGSLSAGHLSDGCVLCPWHHWPFDVKTGECPDNPTIKVAAYPARVVGGRVEAQLNSRPL